jgi:putative transposase
MLTLDTQLVDQLLRNYRTPEDLLGEDGLLKQLTVALLERAISAEMEDPPVYGVRQTYSRNGTNADYAVSVGDPVYEADSPSSKYRRPIRSFVDPPRSARVIRLPSLPDAVGVSKANHAATAANQFHSKIAALYVRGLDITEIREHLSDIHGAELSLNQIEAVTEALIEDAVAWQARPLEPCYPIMYFEAFAVRRSEKGQTTIRQVYLATGVNAEGVRGVLGFWINDPDCKTFWTDMVRDLERRGVEDIVIACVDGTHGLADALKLVLPATEIQLCVAQLIRRSLKHVPARSRSEVVDDLKQIYRAATQQDAKRQLDIFAQKWDGGYAVISQLWQRNWPSLAAYFSLPKEIRKVLVSTNVIEQVGTSLRKITHNRDSFPSDAAIAKSLHLALATIANKRSMPIRDWKVALNQFTILYEDRMSAR